MDGIILLDKIEGITSYDAIKLIKRHYHTSKVGHCGTLDPFASGLLVIGINKATKVLSLIEDDYKEYEATIKFGITTDTKDITGNVISNSDVIKYDIDKINDVLKSFIGVIDQIPPMYSAIHYNGRKLYEYARENINIDVKPRKVEIIDIKILNYDINTLKIYVKCKKGTYIRVLGEDIAKSLNMDGTLSTLRRTKIGNLKVEDANKIDDVKDGIVRLTPIKDVLNIRKVTLDDKDKLIRVYNGQNIRLDATDSYVLVLEGDDEIAIYNRQDDGIYHCYRGLFDETNRFERIRRLQG